MKTLIATIAIVTMIGLIATGCDPSSATPLVPSRPPSPAPTPANHRAQIGLGGSVELPDQGTGISFDRVVEDSRCPANVVCITAGQVVIELTVAEADTSAVVRLSFDTSAVVRLSFEPGSGAQSPWTRVPSSQPGLEGI